MHYVLRFVCGLAAGFFIWTVCKFQFGDGRVGYVELAGVFRLATVFGGIFTAAYLSSERFFFRSIAWAFAIGGLTQLGACLLVAYFNLERTRQANQSFVIATLVGMTLGIIVARSVGSTTTA